MLLQSHHLGEALEEHDTHEVVDQNLAIEALKKVADTLEAKKARLAEETVGLRAAGANLEELQGKVESLGKDLEGAKAAEQLATERTLKAIETVENLCKEANAERETSVALKVQADMLTKWLEYAKAIGLAVAEVYICALG